MEKALANRFQILTALKIRLRGIRIGGESIRSQDKIADCGENNPFKKVTHAAGSKLD
jgi:hypothetical protein